MRALDLLARGARVTVVASSLHRGLRVLHERGDVRWLERPFQDADLDGQWLAVLADRDAALAERMARAAEARQVFYCAIDQPAFGTFAHVAQANAGALTLAISTSGKVPLLARRLREELQRLLDEADIASFLERIAELRAKTSPGERQAVLERALQDLRFSGRLELPDLPGGTPTD